MEHQSEKVKAFLAEVVILSIKHGLAISHEDGHGAFEVVPYEEFFKNWLLEAYDCTGDKP